MQDRQLTDLYMRYSGREPQSVQKLAASGSNRQYFRFTAADGTTAIGAVGTSVEENGAFLYMSRHFRQQGLPVPQILAQSDDASCYLQEDLGSTSLFDAIGSGRQTGRFSDDVKALLHEVMRLLPRVQFVGAEGMDFSRCYPQPEFNSRSVLWDLNYFKYCFLKTAGLEFQEDRLEDDFEAMARVLLSERCDSFMYRDFQSRNVMLRNGREPWLIDYQGGRRGPYCYDVASFLWQARANFPDDLRAELVDEYFNALQPYHSVGREHFERMLRHFVLFRTLQVLGAYGFRGRFEHKTHFIQSIPFAVRNLRQLLCGGSFAEYPYLDSLLRQLVALPQFDAATPAATAGGVSDGKPPLVVSVFSFGYRKGGIPQDRSGNGGGFVFDCRAITNPGRLEQFRSLNGLDRPVIDFIESCGEMQPFLEHAYALVDAAVERYMRRGFTSLMVCFGCTGGQHRSVYAAQHMAEHINGKFGIGVQLHHNEQDIHQTLNAHGL